MLLEPVAELLVGCLLDQRLHAGVAQLGLGLPLELRLTEAYGEDRRDALADVFAGEVVVLLLEQVLGPGVLVDHRGEGGLEPLLVRPAFDGVDAVGEAVDAVGVEPGVPLEGDLDLLGLVGVGVVADFGEQGFLGLVDVPDEVDDAAAVAVDDSGVVVAGAVVAEADLETPVEEGHHLQPLEDGAAHELDGLEDRRIRPERDRRPPPAARRVAGHGELAVGRAAQAEALAVALPTAVDLDDEVPRQGIHHRNAHAVQTAGDLVPVAPELAPAVELGERDLDTGDLVLGMHVDRDAAPIVGNAAAAVGQDRDVDAVGLTRHGLVDGVVDDLPHEVVQPGGAGGTDVHAGAPADGLEPLQHGHVLGPVGSGCLLRHGAPFECSRSRCHASCRDRRAAGRRAQHDASDSTSRV